MRRGGGGGGGGSLDDRKRRQRSEEYDRYGKRRDSGPPRRVGRERSRERIDPLMHEDLNVQLFVGGVNAVIASGEELRDFLNDAMRSSGMVSRDAPDPVVLGRVNPKCGFIDFDSIRTCTIGLNLNGIVFRGTPLKIARPLKYEGPMTPSVTWAEYNSLHNDRSRDVRDRDWDRDRDRDYDRDRDRDRDTRNREDPGGSRPVRHSSTTGDPTTKLLRDLFIGGTTSDMNEVMLSDFIGNAMLKMGLSNSGIDNPIQAIRSSGKFAFAVMRTVEDIANVLNLDGIPFMGVPLKLQRPARCEGQRSEVTHFDFNQMYNMWVSGELKLMTSGPPSRIVRFTNMASAEELEDAGFYFDMIEDMRSECSQFGTVRSIVVPKPLPGNKESGAAGCFFGDEDVGKVFVEMSSTEEARNVLLHLKGRLFAGRTVDLKFFPEDQFRAERYSYVLPGLVVTANLGTVTRDRVYTPQAMQTILMSEAHPAPKS